MTTTTGTTLTPVKGEDYTLTVTYPGGKLIWATLGAWEARMQVRAQRRETATLVADLTADLTKGYSSNDITVVLTLTGAQTRALSSGEYDLFISDPGADDALSKRILWGKLSPVAAVTTAADD